MSIIVKESEKSILELGKFFVTRKSIIILEIVVKQMNGLWFEERCNFCVLVDDISQVDLIDLGIESSVSDPCPEEHPRQDG